MDALIEIQYALNTFYLLMTGALVMWMAAGFAMLEAGMVRSKNTVEILTKNIVLYAIASIAYLLIGYNLMYGEELNAYIPGISWLLGEEHTKDAILASEGKISHSLTSDFFFQVVFVATATSIVSGAVAERMKLWSFLIFAILMSGFIYPIEGFWKWGGGFLDQLGFKDFAGSGVVHLAGASAALAGVLLLGPRLGKYGPQGEIHPLPGANLPLSVLGTFILWLGWFGFNGGSQLIISDIANVNAVSNVIVNTNAAAAGGLVAALILAKLLFGKTDLTMILNGALAGLVAITAEPALPSSGQSVLIGMVGGVIVVLSILLLDRIRIDDPVGAISVHGAAGIWGLLIVPATNPQATLYTQLIGTFCIFAWVFTVSFLVWLLLKFTTGIRVPASEEYKGMDISECGLEAYPEFTDYTK